MAPESALRRLYIRLLRPHLSTPLRQQRVKLPYDVWGYLPLLRIRTLSYRERLSLLLRLLRVDWHVPAAHKPGEVSWVYRSIAERAAQEGEVVVEAGCWMGSFTCKLSLLCKRFGYRLLVYDSFQGVEAVPAPPGEVDFGGLYRAAEETVREHVRRYGDPSVCTFVRGWFKDTIAAGVPAPVRVAYIDCDLAKGTREVLQGVVPQLPKDGVIFSQDFHIGSVRDLLLDAETWRPFGKGMPTIEKRYGYLAEITFRSQAGPEG
jgi:hypothetical protein